MRQRRVRRVVGPFTSGREDVDAPFPAASSAGFFERFLRFMRRRERGMGRGPGFQAWRTGKVAEEDVTSPCVCAHGRERACMDRMPLAKPQSRQGGRSASSDFRVCAAWTLRVQARRRAVHPEVVGRIREGRPGTAALPGWGDPRRFAITHYVGMRRGAARRGKAS